MTQLLAAGEIGRLSAASSVASTDTLVVYQGGVIRRATPAQVAASSGILPTLVANVTLTSAQILTLNATPVQVLAAPGAGFVNVIYSVHATKAAGTAYAGIAAGEDIAFRYTNASGAIIATLEMTGFADSTSATSGVAFGASNNTVANAAIVAHMTTGEITTGDSPFKLTIYYRTFPVPAF